MDDRRRPPWARLAPALLCALAAGCGGGGPEPERAEVPEPVVVRVARVTSGPAPRTTRASGTFFPQEEVTVAAEVAGRIVEIGPEVGDRAEKDALLARVDATDFALAREQRARALQESLTRLGLAALPEKEIDFEALPNVERARHEADYARAKYERAQRLRQTTPGALSDQDLEDLEAAFEVADSGLRAARLAARVDLAQARTRKSDLDLAEQLVRDAVHRVPADRPAWVVAERAVAVGDYVSIGTPLYRLLDPGVLRLRVRIPERRMEGVEKGRGVRVEAASAPKGTRGVVTRVRPEVDLRTRTHDVEIEVLNPDHVLTAGAFAVAEIEVGEDPAVPFVEEGAVVTFAGVTKVFVPEDGKAAERRIATGRRVDGRVEVVSGLAAGAEYVVAPPADLVSGTPLRLEPAPE